MKTPLVTELKQDKELFDSEHFAGLARQTGSVAKAFRQVINEADAVLDRRFLNMENIKLIIRRRACSMVQLMKDLWQQFKCADSPDIALLAVGGYGRAELHPHSDIDLLILLRNRQLAERFRTDLETFVTQLWDIGLE